MRHTGIPIIGDAPWGTHFCQFYQDAQDLADILVPYFKAGLENNEFCMWITSEPFHVEEAKAALAREVADLEGYFRKGQLEIVDYRQWYTLGGAFDAGRVLRGWVDKLEAAQRLGFDGLRLTGNTFWLEETDWQGFTEYEAMVDGVIGRYPMLAICTYSLSKCGAPEIIDVISNHAFALIKQGGAWRLIESAERKRVGASLRETENRLRVTLDSIGDAVLATDIEGRITFLNPVASELTGWPEEQALGRPVREVFRNVNERTGEEGEDIVGRVLREGTVVSMANDTAVVARGGLHIPVEDSAAPIRDETGQVTGVVLVFHDVSDKRRAQEALRRSERLVRLKLESILSPAGDIGRFELADIIDTGALQSLLEDYYELSGIPMAILDLKGEVLVGVGWQDICIRFHRAHPETCRYCKKSDTELTTGVAEGETKLYRCKNGLWDLVTPLMVGGRHVGNLFSGQFFFEGEAVDREWFRSRAARYGFPEDQYLAALDAVPRPSKRDVDAGMGFLTKLGGIISQLSYGNITLARLLSEREALALSLKEGADRLSRAQEMAHLGNWDLDLVNDRLTWSDGVYRIFGLRPREFAATYEAFLKAVHPDDRAAVDAAYSDSLREGRTSYEIEHRVLRRDGEVRWVLEKCEHYTDPEGKVIRSVGMVQDITEHKEAERRVSLLYEQAQQEIARRQQVEQELRRSNEDLGQFAFVISHDLRSPLNAITSFARQLEEDYAGRLGPEADRYLSYLTGAGERVRRLISDLLTYSRMADDGGGGAVTIDSNEALRTAELNLQEKIRETGASITRGELPAVAAGPGLLGHVFQNLLENAIKFRGERAPKVHVSGRKLGDECVFCVADNGIGVDPEHAENIFRIFRRLHGDRYEGTGIGLAICKKIVERLGGRIWLESQPGDGARFWFTLPAAASESRQAAGD